MILINESSRQAAYNLAENFKKHKELWLKILAYKLGINPENITDVAVGIQNREKIRSYEDKMDALIVKTDTRLRYGGGFEVLIVNDRNRRMEPAVGRIMASANKGSSVDIMAGLLLPEGKPNWKSLERSYNVNDVIIVYSDVDLPPEIPGDTEHLYLNPKDHYNRLDVRDKDPILGVRGLNVDESCNTQYCLDFIDNVDSPNVPVDQIECDDYDIIGSIESMMSSYGVAGNIRTMAEKAAKAIRSGFSYTTPDKRWSIEFPPKLNESDKSDETDLGSLVFDALQTRGFDIEYIDENHVRLSFDDERDYDASTDEIWYAISDMVDYDIDFPEKDGDWRNVIINLRPLKHLNESKTGDVSYAVQLKPIKGGSIVNKAVAWLDQNAKVVRQPVEMTVDQANAAVKAFNTHLPRGWGDVRASIKLLHKHEKNIKWSRIPNTHDLNRRSLDIGHDVQAGGATGEKTANFKLKQDVDAALNALQQQADGYAGIKPIDVIDIDNDEYDSELAAAAERGMSYDDAVAQQVIDQPEEKKEQYQEIVSKEQISRTVPVNQRDHMWIISIRAGETSSAVAGEPYFSQQAAEAGKRAWEAAGAVVEGPFWFVKDKETGVYLCNEMPGRRATDFLGKRITYRVLKTDTNSVRQRMRYLTDLSYREKSKNAARKHYQNIADLDNARRKVDNLFLKAVDPSYAEYQKTCSRLRNNLAKAKRNGDDQLANKLENELLAFQIQTYRRLQTSGKLQIPEKANEEIRKALLKYKEQAQNAVNSYIEAGDDRKANAVVSAFENSLKKIEKTLNVNWSDLAIKSTLGSINEKTRITDSQKQIIDWAHMLDEAMEDKAVAGNEHIVSESSLITLDMSNPSDAAKIGGKLNARSSIVRYNGKYYVVLRYDYIRDTLTLHDKPFDSKSAAIDYMDYLNSHGDY